jgi:hypothetical protein
MSDVYDEFSAGLEEAEGLLSGSARGTGGRRIPGGRFRIIAGTTSKGPFTGVWSPFVPSKADLQDSGVRTDVQYTIIASRGQFSAEPAERQTVVRIDDSAQFSIREVTADEVSFTIYVAELT